MITLYWSSPSSGITRKQMKCYANTTPLRWKHVFTPFCDTFFDKFRKVFATWSPTSCTYDYYVFIIKMKWKHVIYSLQIKSFSAFFKKNSLCYLRFWVEMEIILENVFYILHVFSHVFLDEEGVQEDLKKLKCPCKWNVHFTTFRNMQCKNYKYILYHDFFFEFFLIYFWFLVFDFWKIDEIVANTEKKKKNTKHKNTTKKKIKIKKYVGWLCVFLFFKNFFFLCVFCWGWLCDEINNHNSHIHNPLKQILVILIGSPKKFNNWTSNRVWNNPFFIFLFCFLQVLTINKEEIMLSQMFGMLFLVMALPMSLAVFVVAPSAKLVILMFGRLFWQSIVFISCFHILHLLCFMMGWIGFGSIGLSHFFSTLSLDFGFFIRILSP